MTATKQASRHEIDMLNGPLLFKILLFTLPIIGSSVLQTLFNTVDMIVVGHFVGDAAVGAVGTNTSLTSLVTSLFIGLATGTGACVSVAIGARRERDVSDLVHTAMLTAVIGGVVLGVLGYFAAPFLLKTLMNVDESLLGMATDYIRVYFLGAPFLLIYNFGFAIMRTLGDTRRPLLYMLVAGIANVGFNLLFVLVFHLGVVGVALGTIISLAVSAAFVVTSLCRYQNACRLSLRRLRIVPRCLLDILRIGVPAGLRGMLFGISNTMLQASVNSLGPAATSGNAAASSIESFLYLMVSAFGQTATVFVGQNYGAGKNRRIRRALLLCLALTTGIGVVAGACTLLLREPLVALYLPDAPEAALLAYERMVVVFALYFLEGVFETLAGALQGIKISVAPTAVILASVCGLRLAWIFLLFPLPSFHSITGLYACYPVSWAVTSLALLGLILYYFPRKCPVRKEAEE